MLYIDEEMSQYKLCRRIKRLAMGAGLEAEDLPVRARSRQGIRFRDGMATARLL